MERQDLRPLERFLVRLDELPWAVFSRMALGFLVAFVWAQLLGARSQWPLIPFFLFFLAAVRVGLLVVRRLLPFSAAALEIWLARRQMAKRYDSYQWQKLLWTGLGMTVYAVRSAPRSGALITLALFCVVSGAIGLVIWQRSRVVAYKTTNEHARSRV